MNKIYVVISAIGADRIGIVEDLSGILTESGGNIEESKMSVLGGEFAVMMLVEMDAEGVEALEARSPSIETSLGLKLGIKRTGQAPEAKGGRPYSIETVSLDGRGIVHSISTVLRRHNINIEELETKTERAPLTGALLFRMQADIVLTPEVSAAALRREFEELQVGQDLDIILTPLVPARMD